MIGQRATSFTQRTCSSDPRPRLVGHRRRRASGVGRRASGYGGGGSGREGISMEKVVVNSAYNREICLDSDAVGTK